MVKPFGKRVIVRPEAPKTKTDNGVYIPTPMTPQDKPVVGEVIAIGENTVAQIGDKVLFAKYAGTEIEVDNEKLIIIGDESILAKY